MKTRIACLLVALLLGTVGAEAVTVTATNNISAAKAARIQIVITRANQNTCARLGLAPTCDDAAAKGQDPTATIYADANALSTSEQGKLLDSLDSQFDKISIDDAQAAWKQNQATVAPNAQCSAAGLPNGCLRGQVACVALGKNSSCQ